MTKTAEVVCNGLLIEIPTGEAIDNITDALKTADELISYTQCDVYVRFGDEYRRRRWWGCLDGVNDCAHPITFGTYGYYSDWEDVSDDDEQVRELFAEDGEAGRE